MKGIVIVLILFICNSCNHYESLNNIPDELVGNWFDVSGQEYWKYGVQESFLITDNRFWDYQQILLKDSTYKITLVSGDQQKRIELQKIDSSTLRVTENGEAVHMVTNQSEKVQRLPINTPITKTSGPVTISGYIENFSKYNNGENALELHPGWLKVHQVPVDSLGRFEYTFESLFAHNVGLWFNNKWLMLFASPGDSLMIQFNADHYQVQDYNTHFKNGHFMGTYSDICYDLSNYRASYVAALPSYQQQQSKKLHLEPEDYKRYRKEFLQQERNFLIKYCEKNNCSEGFKKWFDKNAEITSYSELMNYPRDIVNTLDVYKEKFYPYESYYSFLDSIPFVDLDALMSAKFGKLVNTIANMKFRHAGIYNLEFWRKRKEKIVLDILYKNEVRSSQDNMLINSIHQGHFKLSDLEPHPLFEQIDCEIKKDWFDWTIKVLKQPELNLLNDLLIANHFYGQVIHGKNYQMMDHCMEVVEQEVKNPEIRSQLFDDYQNLKIKDQELEESEFSGNINRYIVDFTVEEFLKKLRNQYSGQVLYVDFWATWCSPCFEDMKLVEPIKQHFDGKDVTFVYLCSNSNETSWNKRLKEFNPQGEHYFLTNKLTTDLYRKFDITGIPRYVLIDKSGNIVNENAPRPSHREKLIKQIEGLICD